MRKNRNRGNNIQRGSIPIMTLGITAITALFTMTACGEPQVESGMDVIVKNESMQSENSQVENSRAEGSPAENLAASSVEASAPSADGTAGNIFADASESTPAPYEGELTGIVIALPSKELHTRTNSLYDRLLKEINAYTGMEITWEWYDSSSYDAQLEEWILAGEVPDVVLTGRSEVFLNAAEEGMFWEVGPFIDDYDNLATMPEICRVGGSYNGKMYGIPKMGSTADWGLTYRADWLQKLGLEEPTDWKSFCEMLYAFTYKDPDGNGVDDTVGLVVDTDYTVWDVMEAWFGVPNSWGVDENGDLIHKSQTVQYRTAYAAFRELYAKGLINNGSNGVEDFRELEGEDTYGWEALRSEYKNFRGGSTVNWLYNVCGVWGDLVEEGVITAEDEIFALQTSVDTGYGELIYPGNGAGIGDMLAISSTRIKSEEQLKQVLGVINDLCDGDIRTTIFNGWEGEHYTLNENGYLKGLTGSGSAYELMTYNQGFTGIQLGYTAEENAGMPIPEWSDGLLWRVRKQVMQGSKKKCVINAAYQFMSTEDISMVKELEKALLETEIQYITGEIDDAAFEAALNTWMENGGAALTEEVNAKYQKSQKEGFSY